MSESEKDLIIGDANRNCLKRLFCLTHAKNMQKSIFIILVVLLLIIITMLTVFGILTIRELTSHRSEIQPPQSSCRAKRSLSENKISRYSNENYEENFIIKREAEFDEMDELLSAKYGEVNRNYVMNENDDDGNLYKRSNYLRNSIQELESTLDKSENFLKNIVNRPVDRETANLIEKDIRDVEDEINGLDDDIVSLLEISDLTDKSTHKRVRHKRGVSNREFFDLNPVTVSQYAPILEAKKREKRLIQQKLAEVRDEFVRCKKSVGGAQQDETTPDDCEKVYHKVIDRFRQITKKFKEIEDIVSEMEVLGMERGKSDEDSSEEDKIKKDKKKKKKKKNKKDQKGDSSEEKFHKNATTVMENITTTLSNLPQTTTTTTTFSTETSTTILSTTVDSDTTTTTDESTSHQPKKETQPLIVQPEGLFDDETSTISNKISNVVLRSPNTFDNEQMEVSSACPANLQSRLPDGYEHHSIVEEMGDNFKLQAYHPHSDTDHIISERVKPILETLDIIADRFEENFLNPIDFSPPSSHKPLSAESMENVGASHNQGRESFTSLCENLSKSTGGKQAQFNPENQNFAPIQMSGFPTTGEVKGSSKVIMNPGVMTSPLCFVQYPQYRQQPTYLYPAYQYVPMIQPFPTQPGGNSQQNKIDPRSMSWNGFVMQAGRRPQQTSSYRENAENEHAQSYCAFLPNSDTNLPAYYEQTTSRPEAPSRKAYESSSSDERANSYNIPSQFDIIYATYPNQVFAMNQSMQHHHCEAGKLPCFSTNQCILKSKWCDSKVDCIDASDETACSCKARLDVSRICDGFIDCPMGSDELGCFGCDRFQYSCYSSREEFERNGESSAFMCYSSTEKCDGFDNCKNRKDEMECSMIVKYEGSVTTSYLVGHSEGILHRNFKGRWYPACKNAVKWAAEACEKEVGKHNETPQMKVKRGQISGVFIQPSINKPNQPVDYVFTEFCHLEKLTTPDENHVIFVKCPEPKCGSSKVTDENVRVVRHTDDDDDDLKESRIVGGAEAIPAEFPFIVAIYKNGNFHCGGSIYNQHWVITAAHCTRAFENYYYEIRAGILRRLSHSPMAHITKVTHIIRHPDYERSTMKNDIALMRVKHHFNFNRWIRPICMPTKERTGIDDWMFGPKAGTVCSTLGWGAIRERGPDPDSLQVVEVPILPKCKYLNDQRGESVCAGEKVGLKDACQGDSGGPLVCRSVNNPSELYLTGIVSHGEGCARANEPGVYTRTALYLDWIAESVEQKDLPATAPSQDCPGILCVWGAQKCISKASRCNGIVDCLGGEDEINCPLNWFDLILGDAKTDNKTALDPNSISEHSKGVKKVVKKALHEVFRCTKISQVINKEQRCDRMIDCEDGSDERNCTCRDHMKGTFAKLICDGHVDCADSTDELDCMTCKDSEFLCAQSKTCIEKSRHCDGDPDCAFKEDELECMTLTDGHSITLDINGKPFMHRKGIVTRNIKSHWQILCDHDGFLRQNSSQISNDICNVIGFKTAKSFKLIDMTTSQIDTQSDTARSQAMIRSRAEIDRSEIEGCLALEIECSTTQSSSFANLPIQQHKLKRNMTIDIQPEIHFVPVNSSDQNYLKVKTINLNVWDHLKDFDWPWNADILIDGEIAGNGILLDSSWILAEKTLLGSDTLDKNYVTAVLGSSKNQLNIRSPYEQISRVDCIQKVGNSNVILLHLQQQIHFNRHILPSFVPIQNDTDLDSKCIAVAISSQKITKTLELRVIPNCQNDVHLTCYQVASNKSSLCTDSDTSHRIAAILCKKKGSSWYPKAFHRLNKGFCDFNEPVSVFALNQGDIYDKIQVIIDSPCDKCNSQNVANITCATHRCPIGKCLTDGRLCDGIEDCRDGSDETKEVCKKTENRKHCGVHEFRCKNGECVDKSAFCNHHADCGDQSDEPSECTCFDFLRLTDSTKICDGIIHCWDRTDENALYCGTNCEGKFKCEGSIFCVPHELVCDQRNDCPNGADERHCHGLFETSDGFGEVVERSLGLWHTKCFPKSSAPNQEDVEMLCRELGFNNVENLQAIVKGDIIDAKRNGKFSNIKFIPVEFHSSNATKVVLYSKFSPTIINEAFTIHMKTNKPLGKIVAWEKDDHENCLRMEIKCN